VSCGIAKDQVGAHYKANLLPIILGEFVQPIPGKDQAATFLALSPMTQHALVERAQAAWQQKQESLKRPAGESERKAGDAPISPLMRRRLGNGLPTQFAGGSPETQAKKTLAFLAGAAAEA
jgi:hypothetical protein